MALCNYCQDWQCRCDSCFALIEVDNEWFCDMKQEYCSDIKYCGEFDEETGCDGTH